MQRRHPVSWTQESILDFRDEMRVGREEDRLSCENPKLNIWEVIKQ